MTEQVEIQRSNDNNSGYSLTLIALTVLFIFPSLTVAFLYVISMPLILVKMGLQKVGVEGAFLNYAIMAFSYIGALLGAGYISYIIVRPSQEK